jgi:hypothetical protein
MRAGCGGHLKVFVVPSWSRIGWLGGRRCRRNAVGRAQAENPFGQDGSDFMAALIRAQIGRIIERLQHHGPPIGCAHNGLRSAASSLSGGIETLYLYIYPVRVRNVGSDLIGFMRIACEGELLFK